MKVSETWKSWVEAGRALGLDPNAKVRCPNCAQADLVVQDQLVGSGHWERHMRCPACGAYNSMLKTTSGSPG